jgi:hypothetical protein
MVPRLFSTSREQRIAAWRPGRSVWAAFCLLTGTTRDLYRWAREKPPGYSIGWTALVCQEISTAGTGFHGLLFGLVLVFLILAAKHELW